MLRTENKLKLYRVLCDTLYQNKEWKLNFQSVPGETSELLTNFLVSLSKSMIYQKNVFGFCGDNCNTNFGGVKRKGENNVYSRLNK
jgi:hypothetical protein